MADDARGSGAAVQVPTLGVLVVALAAASVPLAHPSISASDGLLRWLFWGAAVLAVLSLLVSFRRVLREHGAAAAIRWLLTGSLPRR